MRHSIQTSFRADLIDLGSLVAECAPSEREARVQFPERTFSASTSTPRVVLFSEGDSQELNAVQTQRFMVAERPSQQEATPGAASETMASDGFRFPPPKNFTGKYED